MTFTIAEQTELMRLIHALLCWRDEPSMDAKVHLERAVTALEDDTIAKLVTAVNS